jgi:hypothetical protein
VLGIAAVLGVTWAVILQDQLPASVEGVLPSRSAGWRWFEYPDYWRPREAGRYLFFNGWHPVFPWVSLVLAGMLVGRADLTSLRVQGAMVVVGVVGYLGLEQLLPWLQEANPLDLSQREIRTMTGTDSWVMFGTTQGAYALSAACTSAAAIGVCLFAADRARGTRALRWLGNAGRFALTLYLLHIWLGMNVQRWIGWAADDGPGIERVWIFSLAFMGFGVAFANLWLRGFGRGPFEALMRRVTG